MRTEKLCRTIIVDDEMLIRQGIKHYLDWEKEGFSIVGEASNGQEALELIEKFRPHIVITDIVMPIMDGEELTRIIKERYPEIEIIILSSFGEFDYVRSAFHSGVVDYILKPKLESKSLLKVLKTAANRIPAFQNSSEKNVGSLSITQVIEKSIAGYEINSDLAFIAEIFPHSHYCLLGINVGKNSNTNVNWPSYLSSKIEGSFQLHLPDAVYYPFGQESNTINILFNIRKEEVNKVISFTKKLAESDKELRFCMTGEFVDFSKIGVVYREDLLNLKSYLFYFPNKNFLMKEDLSSELATCQTFNLDWFTEELKRRNFDIAFQYLQEHVAAFSRCYTTDVFEYKAFFGNVIFNITTLLSNMAYDVKELESEKYSYFKYIDEAHSAEEVVQLLCHFIEKAKSCIHSSRNQPENMNMKKIMDYIMEHYAEPLTLKEVAKLFHFNPSYLSNYFSTHNKEGFIEYLNKIRIEEATKLLTQGTVSISEISGMVGYSDHSYFCKVFKKIKGLSPSQYIRKQNMR